MGELIAWCCEFLEELREEAVEHDLSEEFESCLDGILRGEDCTDRLTGLLVKMGQDVEPTRGGYGLPPGLRGDQGAVLKAVCPNGVCSRMVPCDMDDPGRPVLSCAIQNRTMPEKWVPRA
ncbi:MULTISPECIES: hypothetical protein [unclassified Nonomuraea]|uniref:hypothetical protein n=1 Tax=unclassified Nonomuraea TaxID=2593643 RepID=UPI0033E03F81